MNWIFKLYVLNVELFNDLSKNIYLFFEVYNDLEILRYILDVVVEVKWVVGLFGVDFEKVE